MKVKRSSYFIPFKKNSEFDGALGKMFKGGFVNQQSAGIYTWLNLGIRSLDKLIKIIEEAHQEVNAIKILAPMTQEASLWKKSQRFFEYGDEILKIKDRKNHDFIFGPSAEELFCELLTKFSLNKNNFPLTLYNIQWKFRDEIRPRFGIIRSREFLMKDAYSFHKTKECLLDKYQEMFNLYSNIFHKLGLKAISLNADVGLMGGFLSHEFLVESEFGETNISFKEQTSEKISWNERDYAFECENGKKYAEIGHIYALGDKYSKTFSLKHPETQEPVLMGCYGIGISRIIGIMFEKNDLGILAPFEKTLITIGNDEAIMNAATKIFDKFPEIIWDDRENVRPGEKFNEADLIGSPIQIIVGSKELAQNKVIIKQNNIKKEISLTDLLND